MLKNDVSLLSKRSGLSPSTIRRRAARAGLDVSPFGEGRCDKTIDAFSGETVNEEHQKWLAHALTKILAVEDRRCKKTA